MSYRKNIIISTALLIQFAPALASHNAPLKSNAWISNHAPIPIEMKHIGRAFKQCSRSAPKNDGGFWVPSNSEIQWLEKALELYLTKNAQQNDSFPSPKAKPYQRQYVGYLANGKRKIYGSFIPEELAHPFLEDPLNRDFGHAIWACDGGNAIWGIVYDIETGKFSELKTNGYI